MDEELNDSMNLMDVLLYCVDINSATQKMQQSLGELMTYQAMQVQELKRVNDKIEQLSDMIETYKRMEDMNLQSLDFQLKDLQAAVDGLRGVDSIEQ